MDALNWLANWLIRETGRQKGLPLDLSRVQETGEPVLDMRMCLFFVSLAQSQG